MHKALLMMAAGVLLSFGSYAAGMPGPSAHQLVENIVQNDDAYFNQHVVFPRHTQIKNPNALLVKHEPVISVKGVASSRHLNILASNSHKKKYKLKPFVRKKSSVELNYEKAYKKVIAARMATLKRKNIVRAQQTKIVRLPPPLQARTKMITKHKPTFIPRSGYVAKLSSRGQRRSVHVATLRAKPQYNSAHLAKITDKSKLVGKLPESVHGMHHKAQHNMGYVMHQKHVVPTRKIMTQRQAMYGKYSNTESIFSQHRQATHHMYAKPVPKVVAQRQAMYGKYSNTESIFSQHRQATHHMYAKPVPKVVAQHQAMGREYAKPVPKVVAQHQAMGREYAKPVPKIARHQKPSHHRLSSYDLPRLRVVKNRDFFPPLMSTPKRFYLRQAKKISYEPKRSMKKTQPINVAYKNRNLMKTPRFIEKHVVQRKQRYRRETIMHKNVVVKRSGLKFSPQQNKVMGHHKLRQVVARTNVEHSLPMKKMIERKMTQHRGRQEPPKIIASEKAQYHQPPKAMVQKQTSYKELPKVVVRERVSYAKKPFQLHGFKVIPQPVELKHEPEPMKMFFKLEKTYS